MSPGRDPVLELAEELGRRTGLRTHSGRLDLIRRVLEEHVPEGRPDVRDPALMDALVDAAAIDESYFFRHPHQLAFVRETVLPRLLAERPGGERLRLWSAGCADGEEPYTLAILLAEEGLLARSSILATDLSNRALDRARAATYSAWALRSDEVASRSALFRSDGRRFRLDPAITAQVTFRQHNLLDPAYPTPPGGFDLILCRNVLVHLEPAAVATVLSRLAAALAPGGWLVTAPADPPALDVPGELLEPVVLPSGGLVYRRSGPGSAPADRGAAATVQLHRSPGDAQVRSVRGRATVVPPRGEVAVEAGTDGRQRCLEARRLLADGRPEDAFPVAQAAAFLDPDLPVAHLTLGLAAQELRRTAVAARAFRRAAALLDGVAPDEPVELCDGESAGRLAELARAHALLHGEASA